MHSIGNYYPRGGFKSRHAAGPGDGQPRNQIGGAGGGVLKKQKGAKNEKVNQEAEERTEAKPVPGNSQTNRVATAEGNICLSRQISVKQKAHCQAKTVRQSLTRERKIVMKSITDFLRSVKRKFRRKTMPTLVDTSPQPIWVSQPITLEQALWVSLFHGYNAVDWKSVL